MSNIKEGALVGLVALVLLLVLDVPWLVLVAADLYGSTVPSILRQQPSLGAAAAFYLIYAWGLAELAIRPALAAGAVAEAARRGAILGIVSYATFSFTNLAVIEGWTLKLALVDVAWGCALSAATAYTACWLAMRMRGLRIPTGGK